MEEEEEEEEEEGKEEEKEKEEEEEEEQSNGRPRPPQYPLCDERDGEDRDRGFASVNNDLHLCLPQNAHIWQALRCKV